MATKKKTSKKKTTKTVDKAARFSEVGSKRLAKSVKAIRMLANLSNKNSYKYSDEQAEKIVSKLRAEIDTLEQRFKSGKAAVSEEFSL